MCIWIILEIWDWKHWPCSDLSCLLVTNFVFESLACLSDRKTFPAAGLGCKWLTTLFGRESQLQQVLKKEFPLFMSFHVSTLFHRNGLLELCYYWQAPVIVFSDLPLLRIVCLNLSYFSLSLGAVVCSPFIASQFTQSTDVRALYPI